MFTKEIENNCLFVLTEVSPLRCGHRQKDVRSSGTRNDVTSDVKCLSKVLQGQGTVYVTSSLNSVQVILQGTGGRRSLPHTGRCGVYFTVSDDRDPASDG